MDSDFHQSTNPTLLTKLRMADSSSVEFFHLIFSLYGVLFVGNRGGASAVWDFVVLNLKRVMVVNPTSWN